MKHKKILIISGVTTLSLFAGGFIASQTMKHVMNNTDSTSHSSAHTATHSMSSEDTKNVQTSTGNGTEDSKTQVNNVNNEAKATSVELQDIEFVQYTVKANDTLWRIAHTYMPDYNAYPEDGKAGVIDYIVKENKLSKAVDGKFVVFAGQKLTIPKQKEITLDINKSTAATNSKTVSSEKMAQVNSTSSISSSSKSNNSSVEPASNSIEKDNDTSEDNIDHSNHTDHSSH